MRFNGVTVEVVRGRVFRETPEGKATAESNCPICNTQLGYNVELVCVKLIDGNWHIHHDACYTNNPNKPERYVPRNLPCTDRTWAVLGRYTYTPGGGVLEWCDSEQDANERKAMMEKDNSFSDLRVAKV